MLLKYVFKLNEDIRNTIKVHKQICIVGIYVGNIHCSVIYFMLLPIIILFSRKTRDSRNFTATVRLEKCA